MGSTSGSYESAVVSGDAMTETSTRESRGWIPLEIAEYAVLRASVAALGRLSHPRALDVGAAIGEVYGRVARSLRLKPHRVAETNLEIAFPDLPFAERDLIRRRMWRNWGRMLIDVTRLGRLDATGLKEIVRLDPQDAPAEIFRRAREGGSLVLTAHFGSFELLHAGCAAHGYPITLVHRTLPNRLVDAWLTRLREGAGSHVLRRGAAAREILRALREGRVVALPFDQRARGGSAVFVPFFGIPAATNSGVARLAAASGAPVFPAVLVRDGDSTHHRALFGPEIDLVRSADREADVFENSRRLNAALERLIREHPDHWIWMYSRWKRNPAGLPSPYRSDGPPVAVLRELAAQSTGTGTARSTMRSSLDS